MAHIEWKESYEIGVESVDNQHKKLVGITNELYEAHHNQTGNLIIHEILERLVLYTKEHFSDEEKNFDFGYQDAEKHKREHREFVQQIESLVSEAKRKNLMIPYKTLDFLKDWLISHILGTDKELGYYLRKKTRI